VTARMLLFVLIPLLLIGCVQQAKQPPIAGDGPVNPRAPEAPVASIATPFILELAPPATSSDMGSPPSAASPMQHMDMKGTDMPDMDMPGMDMPGMGRGQKPAAAQPSQTAPDMEGMHHSHPGSATRPAATQALYTCKMHPQIVADHPGKCPICGMTLVAREGPK
jgi:hypothetical protein